jgi:hypothetical protein
MTDQGTDFSSQVRGAIGQAASRLVACLSPDGLREAVQGRVAEQWQRSEPQREKLGDRWRQGSAKLAAQPMPKVARQGLEHLDALIARLTPSPANGSSTADAWGQTSQSIRQDVASETLVSPLDDASLNHHADDDNCIAAGTTPPGAAAADGRPGRRPEGRPRRSRGGSRSRRSTPEK